MEKQFRYPGARPFTENDRKLFFGRDRDIELLTERVALEKLVVLFGKSGYGKTSLLQAGVLPRLRETERHRVISIRLNQPETNPLVQVIGQVKGELGAAPFLGERLDLEKELPDDLISLLWCYLKSLQAASPENPSVTLVFDPFEELFYLYQPHVESFGRALAAMLDPRPPKAVRRLIKDRIQAGGAGLSEDEIDGWFRPLNLKVLLSLRHDHLGSLDSFKQFVPFIFKHTYELKPLMGTQALEALEKPAALEGPYASPPFTYSAAALGKIVEVLKDPKTLRIETFQLQLVAQRAEEVIIGKAQANPELKQFELSSADLGNPELIFENHYQEIVSGLARKDQGRARWLVEKKLIVKDARVPLPQQVITEQYHVPALLLNALVEKRLLRSEVNSVGGTSFELSHDTLVGPIQKSARKRNQRLWRRRLQATALVALLLLLSVGSWGFYEKFRADGLQSELDSLKKSRPGLITTVPDNSQQEKVEALERENETQRIKLVTLQTQYDSIKSLKPETHIDTVYIRVNEPLPPFKDIDVTIPLNGYAEWLKKLNALKTRVLASPDAEYTRVAGAGGRSDTRAPAEWQFNPAEVHLLAVRINVDQGQRIFDARNYKAFYVLLIDGKAFEFLGGTGYFTHDGHVAFLAKGQHGLKLGSPRSDRKLVPVREGLRLIRDVDNTSSLTAEDISRGFIGEPGTDVAITWATGSNAITQPGQQLLFNQNYINPSGRIVSKSENGSNARLQDAYQVFTGMLWNQSQNQEIRYTLVDLTDFNTSAQQEIVREIDRLRTGL